MASVTSVKCIFTSVLSNGAANVDDIGSDKLVALEPSGLGLIGEVEAEAERAIGSLAKHEEPTVLADSPAVRIPGVDGNDLCFRQTRD